MRIYTTILVSALTVMAVLGPTGTAFAQLGNGDITHYNWDKNSSSWKTGNSFGWIEGDNVPHAFVIKPGATADTAFVLAICLEAIQGGSSGFISLSSATTGHSDWGITHDPDGVAIPALTGTGAVQGSNVTSISDPGAGVQALAACGGDANEVGWIASTLVTDAAAKAVIYFAADLLVPGQNGIDGTPVGDLNGPSSVANWFSRVQAGGQKTTTIGNVGNAGIVLPVELVSFTAQLDGPDAVLNWATATESNNAGFAVEHSSNGAAFSEVDFVEGRGTTLERQDYTFRVTDIESGRHQFRLKQIDFDGAFEYSPIVEIASEVPGTHALSSAYPNPFNPSTSFSLIVSVTQDVQIGLYDALGRQVRTVYDGNLEANVGKVFTVDADGLPSGTYMYVVRGNNFRDSRNIVLLK